MVTKLASATILTDTNTYKCPSCQQAVSFPFHGNSLYCPKCHHSEPLYDYGISYLYHLHYSEYNCGPGVSDGS